MSPPPRAAQQGIKLPSSSIWGMTHMGLIERKGLQVKILISWDPDEPLINNQELWSENMEAKSFSVCHIVDIVFDIFISVCLQRWRRFSTSVCVLSAFIHNPAQSPCPNSLVWGVKGHRRLWQCSNPPRVYKVLNPIRGTSIHILVFKLWKTLFSFRTFHDTFV